MNIIKFMYVVLDYIKKRYYLIKIILLFAAAATLLLGYLFMQTNEKIELEKTLILEEKV